jgi:hypothetical protein
MLAMPRVGRAGSPSLPLYRDDDEGFGELSLATAMGD